jgi:hypothetical protein
MCGPKTGCLGCKRTTASSQGDQLDALASLETTQRRGEYLVPTVIGVRERTCEMAERVHRTQVGCMRPNANPDAFVPEKNLYKKKCTRICTRKSGKHFVPGKVWYRRHMNRNKEEGRFPARPNAFLVRT